MKELVDFERLTYNAGVSPPEPDVISLKKYASEKGRSYYDNLVMQRELFKAVEKKILTNKSIEIKDYLNMMVKLESEYERE